MVGRDCHDAAWGYKRRPLSNIEKLNWKRIVFLWASRGRLRYSEMLTIAKQLGADASRPTEPEALREEFARRLREIGETRPRFDGKEVRLGKLRQKLSQAPPEPT